MNTRHLITVALLFSAVKPAGANSVPEMFTVQGVLRKSGVLQDVRIDATPTLFKSSNGPEAPILTFPAVTNVLVKKGLFTVNIPVVLDDLKSGLAAAEATEVWLGLTITNRAGGLATTLPRQRVTSQLFALIARHAEYADWAGGASYADKAAESTKADELTSTCVGCVKDEMIESVSASKVNIKPVSISVVANSKDITATTRTPVSISSACSPGLLLVGGGCTIDSSGGFTAYLTDSYGSGLSWTCSWHINTVDVSNSHKAIAQAYCLSR